MSYCRDRCRHAPRSSRRLVESTMVVITVGSNTPAQSDLWSDDYNSIRALTLLRHGMLAAHMTGYFIRLN